MLSLSLCANWAVGRGHLAQQAKLVYLHPEGEETERTRKASVGSLGSVGSDGKSDGVRATASLSHRALTDGEPAPAARRSKGIS